MVRFAPTDPARRLLVREASRAASDYRLALEFAPPESDADPASGAGIPTEGGGPTGAGGGLGAGGPTGTGGRLGAGGQADASSRAGSGGRTGPRCGTEPGGQADASIQAGSGSEAVVPDPFDDAEALEALETRITALASRIHAATHRLLVLIAEFDRRGGWKLGGHRSCSHWLSVRTGIDLGTAREKVRTARALVGLPKTSASMSRGELAFSKARALTRRANAENEGELLEIAKNVTTAELERVVRAFPEGSRKDEAALERERYASRTLSVFPDNEGMYVVRGRLPAEVGALLMRAVEAAGDVLYREERGGSSGGGALSETEARAEAARRRADALGLLAERALAAGFGLGELSDEAGDAPGGKRGSSGGAGEASAEAGDASIGAGDASVGDGDASVGERDAPAEAPISGSRAERYQVMLHVEAETLAAEGEGGRSELEDGTRVSAETAQRISCDCGLVKVTHASDGSILDVGRRTRTIPPSLRRALEVRDKGCRFPGCGSRFTEGHHIVHWAHGGGTSLANALLMCRFHHRLVHEGGWTVRRRDDGQPEFISPSGKAQTDTGG